MKKTTFLRSPWKLLNAVMVVLSLAMLVASFVGWPQGGIPWWFILAQLAWNITLMRRTEHVPYPTVEGFLARPRPIPSDTPDTAG